MSIEKSEKPLGMGWYNFLIYFSLFASAVVNIIYGFGGYLFGGIYFISSYGQIAPEMVYEYYPLLQALNIIYGLFLIGVAIFEFTLRQKLAHYKPDAPKLVYIYSAIQFIAPLIYVISVFAIKSSSIIEAPFNVGTSDFTFIVKGLAFLIFNIIYFKKREHLFVEEDLIQNHIPAQRKVVQPQTISSENLFCRKCGAKIMPDSSFCHKCGEKVVIPSIEQEPPKEAPAEVKTEPKQEEKVVTPAENSNSNPTEEDIGIGKRIGLTLLVVSLLILVIVSILAATN